MMESYYLGHGNYCSYYGSWNAGDKPLTGVHIFMLNEHVKRVIEEEKDAFRKEIGNVIANFNESVKHLLEKVKNEVRSKK
jgi:hypothetical protein